MSPAANDSFSTGPAKLPQASQDPERTVDDPSPRSRAATPSAATRIRCPSCHSPIQLADDRSDGKSNMPSVSSHEYVVLPGHDTPEPIHNR